MHLAADQMATHRFCYVTFRGEGKTSEIAEFYVNGERKDDFDYMDEALDYYAEKNFELISHTTGQKGTSFMAHYFTFKRMGGSSAEAEAGDANAPGQ